MENKPRAYFWLALATTLLLVVSGATLFARQGGSERNGDVALPQAPLQPLASHDDAARMSEKSAHSTPVVERAFPPLPDKDTPLIDVFQDLRNRMAQGDLEAGDRLFENMKQCRWRDAWVNYGVNYAVHSTANADEDELRRLEGRLDYAQHIQKFCRDMDEAQLKQLVPVMLEAARHGVRRARTCYLYRGPMMDVEALLEHPEYLTTYRDEASRLIEQGLSDGDWRIVDMLQYAYGYRNPRATISGVIKNDPIEHYRYLKLFRIGADEFMQADLDQRLARAREALSVDAAAAADAWAIDMAARNFKGSSTQAAPQGWDACGPD
ncbi:MAG: hypothetical protein KDI69_11620 [Xanthomonadales bacterium]|nr:hypothetical protein [Xanthomonadales bacterium]